MGSLCSIVITHIVRQNVLHQTGLGYAVLHCVMLCCAVLCSAVSRFAITLDGMTAGKPPWYPACGQGHLPVTAAERAALEQPVEAGICSVQQPEYGRQGCCGRS